MEHIIEIEHLNKAFGDVHAVNDCRFMCGKGNCLLFSA